MNDNILLLDAGGLPCKWVNQEKAAYYYTKGVVLWECGVANHILHGGINAHTSIQSTLRINSIIAISGQVSSKRSHPVISNKLLFKRDGMQCAYCGHIYSHNDLTRDHIHPKVLGGKNTWTNIITACRGCNSHKGSTLLTTLKWELLFEPYIPTHAEVLFLRNINMSLEQYEYLITFINEDKSRIHQLYNREIGNDPERDS